MKRTFKIVDANHNRFTLTATIKDLIGDKKGFSMSGEGLHSAGQIVDSIVPADYNQKRLIKIWREHHLNDTNAGTEAQMEALKKDVSEESILDGAFKIKTEEEIKRLSDGIRQFWKETMDEDMWERYIHVLHSNRMHDGLEPLSDDEVVDADVEVYVNDNFNAGKVMNEAKLWLEQSPYHLSLAKLRHLNLLYDVHPETGEPYKYGTEWLYKALPEDLEDELNELIDEIEEEFEQQDTIADTDKHKALFEEFDYPEEVHALAMMLELTVAEVEDIEQENQYEHHYDVQGTLYFCGTEDEALNAVKDYIEESLWAFNPSFLCFFGVLDDMDASVAYEILKPIQERCEAGNDAVKALVNWDENSEEITQYAIDEDGVGHFLNGYDGEDMSYGDYIACRRG